MHGEYSAPYRYYEDGGTRSIARRLKRQEDAAIQKAASELSKFIPENCVLVPMPSHTGVPVAMKTLCKEIAKRTHSTVIYAIQGAHRETLYAVKKRGQTLSEQELAFVQVKPLPLNKDVIVIDNVVDSGRTALAACHAIQNSIVLAYAYTTNPKLHGLFFYKPEEMRKRLERRQFMRSLQQPNMKP